MVSLVVHKYPTRVKVKKIISMHTATIEEVMYVKEDKGTSETSMRRRGATDKETFDGGSPSVVGIAEGDVEGQWGVTGVGADSEQRDVEEAGLEEVSGCHRQDWR
jgi:hypothetical protein